MDGTTATLPHLSQASSAAGAEEKEALAVAASDSRCGREEGEPPGDVLTMKSSLDVLLPAAAPATSSRAVCSNMAIICVIHTIQSVQAVPSALWYEVLSCRCLFSDFSRPVHGCTACLCANVHFLPPFPTEVPTHSNKPVSSVTPRGGQASRTLIEIHPSWG